jgi:hypothetical protein
MVVCKMQLASKRVDTALVAAAPAVMALRAHLGSAE